MLNIGSKRVKMTNLSVKIRKLLSYLFVIFLLNGFATQAQADGSFLLQLGSFDSKSEATQKWKDIKKHNPDLAKLSLHISEIAMPPSNVMTYRVQVGTLSTREEANSICDNLQNKGVDCLVVETALFADEVPDDKNQPITPEKTEPKVVAELAPRNLIEETPTVSSTATQSNPTVASDNNEKPHLVMVPGREPKFLDDEPVKVAVVPQPKADLAKNNSAVERGSFFERLFDSSQNKQSTSSNINPPVKLKPSPVGNVEVAEAIRVPLSKEDAPKPNYQITQVASTGASVVDNTGQNYWAQLNYFANEAQAQEFYDDFRSANSNLSDGIRMRVTHPYLHNSSKVSLRVGPFVNKEDIASICKTANSSGLHCTTVKEVSTNIASNTQKEKLVNNDLSGHYYVQLGSFDSYDEALISWETTKKENKKILGKLKPVIQTPEQNSSNSPVYRLRTGPFASQQAAYSMCDSLWQAGENCLIVRGE